MPASVEILHSLPGRIRLRLHDPALVNGVAGNLQLYLTNQRGIKEVRWNSVCASLLLHYDPAVWTAQALAGMVGSIDKAELQRNAPALQGY